MPAHDNAESAVEEISGLQDQWHYLLLGKPVSQLVNMQLHQPELVDVVADIATELPLPGDTLLKGAKRVCQFTGILGGVLSGQPLLVNACLKSLVHDLLADKVREAIGHALSDTLGLQQKQDPPYKSILNEDESQLKLSNPDIRTLFNEDHINIKSACSRFEKDYLKLGTSAINGLEKGYRQLDKSRTIDQLKKDYEKLGESALDSFQENYLKLGKSALDDVQGHYLKLALSVIDTEPKKVSNLSTVKLQ